MTRLVFAGAGIVLLAIFLTLYQKVRPVRLLALLGIFLGVGCVSVAIFPGILDTVMPLAHMKRMRLVVGLISLMVLLFTLETVRRTSMQERYALLWVSTGLVLCFLALFPDSIAWLVKITGMHYTSAIMVVIFTFLILIAFHFSLTLSRIQEDKKKLAQRTGMLELRIAELERGAEDAQPDSKGDAQPSDSSSSMTETT